MTTIYSRQLKMHKDDKSLFVLSRVRAVGKRVCISSKIRIKLSHTMWSESQFLRDKQYRMEFHTMKLYMIESDYYQG